MYLKEKECDLNITDRNDQSAATWAASRGQLEVLQLLAENKVTPVNVANCNIIGISPIIEVAARGRLEVVKYLEKKGADLMACDCSFVSPLTAAAGEGHLEVVKYIASVVDINTADGNGNTTATGIDTSEQK